MGHLESTGVCSGGKADKSTGVAPLYVAPSVKFELVRFVVR